MTPILDTNVLLRHILRDHSEHSPRARALLLAIAQGERTVMLPETALFETVYTLERLYRIPRENIADALLPLLQLPHLIVPNAAHIHAAFALYLQHRARSFADCVHAALALQSETRTIL